MKPHLVKTRRPGADRRRQRLLPRIEFLEDRLELALVPTGVTEFHANTTTAEQPSGAVSAAAIQFPVQLGEPAQNTAALQAAQADAQSARTLALVAIAVGIVGVVVGLIGLGMARSRRGSGEAQASTSTVRPASERV